MPLFLRGLVCLIGIGAVIKNDEGKFLAAMSKRLNIHTDPSSAEAIAALYATKFARDHHFPLVAFEGDACHGGRQSG